jgi:hypothetical protein
MSATEICAGCPQLPQDPLEEFHGDVLGAGQLIALGKCLRVPRVRRG